MLSQFNNFHKVTRFLSVIEKERDFMRREAGERSRKSEVARRKAGKSNIGRMKSGPTFVTS